MAADFERIAIVNRGEPAVRLIRAVRELNHETHSRLRTIALFTEPDKRALFVREADEAYALGPATYVDETGARKSSYLDYARLERALRDTRSEAAWVGWGFVAEHSGFAELCERLGVTFIGPHPRVMRELGDKIFAKRLSEKTTAGGVGWSGGPVETLEEARAHAGRLGLPLMIKATAGGGGRGIRRVRSLAELPEAFESARSEALQFFGDSTVFMEQLLEGARHVEVQIIGDRHGTIWALGVRDCTIQRRNQKVVEESPSPALSTEQEAELCAAALRLAREAGYYNAGTVEFLYDPGQQRFSFMEVNARLQVEHPVTEALTGADLVKLQIHVAQGGRLEGDPPTARGHAIEVRINAEDAERGFAPAPGVIELFRPAGGPGLRLDTGFIEGDAVAPEFDSMLGKLIAFGRDRAEALARLERGLLETRLALRGGATNKGFLLALLRRPEVASGEFDVSWLDRLAAQGEHLPREHAEIALLQGAIEAYEADLAVEQARFFSTAARGRPALPGDVGLDVELRHGGHSYPLRVCRIGPRDYRVELDGRSARVSVERLGRLECRLRYRERDYRVLNLSSGADRLVEVEGVPHRLLLDSAGLVRAPGPAVVLSISVAVGDVVERGDRLLSLEAMKTEQVILAPFAGRVREVTVHPSTQVDAGQPLCMLEPVEREDEAAEGDRIKLEEDSGAETGIDAHERCRRNLDELRCLVLGLDVDPDEARRLNESRLQLCRELPPDDPDLLSGEDRILAAFTDVCGLFRRRDPALDVGDGATHSPEEYLLIYLRALDSAGEGLPLAFLDRLRRTLTHYGVDSLERTRALEESLFWIWKARQRMAGQVAVVLGILERRLDRIDELAPAAGDDFRVLLDRIVAATRGRYQAVSDFAREVRYRYFDRPFFESLRDEAYAEASAILEALSAPGEVPAREDKIEALVDFSYPLSGLLLGTFDDLHPTDRAVALEVLTRRYYRIRELEGLRALTLDGRDVVVADYALEGQHYRVLSVYARFEEYAEAARSLRTLLEQIPPDRKPVIDFYVRRDSPHSEADVTEREIRAQLDATAFPRRLHRVVTAIAAPGGGRGMGALQHFTHRGGETGFEEDRLYRGMHAMMGKRLQIWRLANFEIERLSSAEDVHLFYGVSRTNPKDERLFAFAEVRDLTPIEENGREVRLPHLEMMLMEALAGIRLFQSRRSARQRLHWNRALLYVWPPLRLSAEQINDLARRLAPATADLGLEKVVVRARVPERGGGLRDTVIQIGTRGASEIELTMSEPADAPIRGLSEYQQKVVRMRQRGMLYPYEVISMLTPADGARGAFPPGEFTEYDLDDDDRLVPVVRPPGGNRANVIVGLIRNRTAKHPRGMERVILLGDPSREMGSVAEPECRRINLALDLAEERGVPVDWFAISAGAKISMETGTETMDWCAAVIRRLVEFTQAGGEVNVVVNGVNVGAQSYWDAEATMLMHTRGILVMTPEGSAVLTGKRALDFSGSVSAEDNEGIGGYERIMGPNGQAQHWAGDIVEACRILLRHYDHTYVVPGERFPRRAASDDPRDRDVGSFPHGRDDGCAFDFVSEIFSNDKNPGRRKPFDITRVMQATIDQDHPALERWKDMREAETAVVWDAHLGGIPVCMIGIQSRPLRRIGLVPADGPENWTSGTLFPLSSKKVARAINAASSNRPVVILANLAGFDGSPESMRRLQLEYGAEIGRAVVNFRGPIVMCVVSRYHGGAYVVFSSVLNENLEVSALEGSHASVIGGAPAAAVVFSRDVERRTREDPRLQELDREIASADDAQRGRLRARWHELYESVYPEKLGELAAEFDAIHSVERARQVGSLHHTLEPARLRPYLIDAVERGMERELERWRSARADPRQR